jgi:hypothetical protein
MGICIESSDFEVCDDAIDNDNDGLIDCDDQDCAPGNECSCVSIGFEPNEYSYDGLYLGQLYSSDSEIVMGNIFPAGDKDFYRFEARENDDNAIASFAPDIRLLDDGNGAYRIRVWKHNASPENLICAAGVAYGPGFCNGAPTSYWEEIEDTWGQDDSTVYLIEVEIADGSLSKCVPYSLEVSNDLYH